MVTVYEVREQHSWGEQVIATVWDKSRADAYCTSRPSHTVVAVEMQEDDAFREAE